MVVIPTSASQPRMPCVRHTGGFIVHSTVHLTAVKRPNSTDTIRLWESVDDDNLLSTADHADADLLTPRE